MDLFDKCKRFVRAKDLVSAGLYPYFRAIGDSEGTSVVIDGRPIIMIGSNNYLGLTHHPHVKEAAVKAVERYGASCTGSRFLNGTLDLHEELEFRLAKFMKREAAVTFSTGFQVNLGVISSLVGKNDTIYCDRENHASLIDGCRLSFGELKKYRHNDPADLERLLAEGSRRKGGRLIVMDGVFSMLGDVADLPAFCKLRNQYGARLFVDDAHGIGVMGKHGRGTAEHFGLEKDTDLIMGTFSKSLASLGGFITGDEEVIHFIKHNARSLMFSASMTPANAASVVAALDLLEAEPERIRQVWANADFVRQNLRQLGFDVGDAETPIAPIILGEQVLTFRFWKELFEEGVFTNPVVSPGVPAGKDLIRTSYMATHTRDQLTKVVEIFEKVGRRLGVLPEKTPQPAPSH